MGFVFKYGIVVGLTGFILGFFGPMIFMPEANQGPMLGISITGPLGFICGSILGFYFYRLHRRYLGYKHPLHILFPGPK